MLGYKLRYGALSCLLAGAMTLVPLSAHAATPAVSSDAKTFTVKVQTGYAWNTVEVKAINANPVLLFTTPTDGSEYGATSYRVTIRHGKDIIYAKTMGTYQALYLFIVMLHHDGGHGDDLFDTRAELLREAKSAARSDLAEGCGVYRAVQRMIQQDLRDQVYKDDGVQAVHDWVDANPSATTFDAYDTKGSLHGLPWTLTGTPAAWHFTLTDPRYGTAYTEDQAGWNTTDGEHWETVLPGSSLSAWAGIHAASA